MKKHFALALAIVGAMGFFTSCSDDDDSPVVPGSNLEAKTYHASSDLTLSVDGTANTTQSVVFTPASDGTATITLKGEPLDIASLMSGMSLAADVNPSLAFPTSCVIPGSAEASFKVTLSGTGDKSTFEGNSTTDYCTFAYSGEVTKEAMTLSLSDIKLKNTSMAGTYSTRELGDNFFNVLRVQWESEKNVPFLGSEMPIQDLVRVVLVMPIIPQGDQTVAAGAMIPELLKSVTLGEDGSITAKYADTAVEGMPVTESPKGYARYVVKDDNTILVFIDPQAIIANTVKNASKGSSVDMNSLIEGLVTNVAPMLVNGVPVNYGPRIMDEDYTTKEPVLDPDTNAVSFYLGTETLLPILKTIAPIFSDEEIVNAIVEAASKDPDMAFVAAILPGMLQAIPEVINTTSKIEIGINLYK